MVSLNTRIWLGAGAGIGLGLWLHQADPVHGYHDIVLHACDVASSIFINLLKMVLIPVVLLSISTGMATLGGHRSARSVWTATLAFFLATPLVASILGLTAVNLFEPGKGMTISQFQQLPTMQAAPHVLPPSALLEKLVSQVLVNPFHAMAESDILATLVFGLLFGAALARLDRKVRVLVRGMKQMLEAMMLLVGWIMELAPFGVLALLTRLIATQDAAFFLTLLRFVLVILGTLALHGFVILPLALFLFTGMTPWTFLYKARHPLVTAFATCSSSATLPLTLKTVREEFGVSRKIAGFVPPLGATVNMDGTAIYEAGAALFVANLAGLDLDLPQQAVICFMAMLSSVGAPGIPSAGMVTMVMVLQAVGLPVEALAILLPIDRFMDAFRTMINVEGDMIGAMIVQKVSTARKPAGA
ncbi:MAG: hypothetical protein RIQ52_1717 [Pseudomonadota bacterium]|jgi:Na+/H+-dicarboxylate symporter